MSGPVPARGALRAFLGTLRTPFVLLTPAVVSVGIATAVWRCGSVRALDLFLALAGAVCAHLSVNALNEYFDFKSGLDFRTSRTPFSGGSGVLPAHPGLAPFTLAAGLATLAGTGLVGAYFALAAGWRIVPLGILGMAVIVSYTPWIAKVPLLCLFAPGLGFGTLMVMGVHFALAGEYSLTSFFASLVPFFLVSDLLLLNQFPDVAADRSAGRMNLPISLGRRGSAFVYGLFLFLAYLSIVLGGLLGYLPPLSLLGLLTVVLAVPAFVGAVRFAEEPGKLVPYLGMNVAVNLATPVLLAAGILLS